MSVGTREQSTLVIATVLASASLLLLTVPLHALKMQLFEIAQIGFFLGLIGLFYRQVTTWTIDRIAHNRDVDLNRNDVPFWRNHRRAYFLYSGVREFLFLWFLSIPIVLWALVWHYELRAITGVQTLQIVLVSVSMALVLTYIDFVFRVVDWRHHH